jgi:3',5'-nucleoside bisphosphate phosphatase
MPAGGPAPAAGARESGMPVARSPLAPILADLHVHTVLSPCAEVEMIPPLIVERALALGLGLIAITDHNAAANCESVIQAARGTGLVVLPGMEVQTSEEVHVLCLFDTLEQALTWQGIVFNHLPDLPNREATFGAQYVVDAGGGYLRTETRLLLTSTDLPLESTICRVSDLGGLAIPAHVDRASFSLLANLGFVPEGLPSPALELFRLTSLTDARARWPQLVKWPLIHGGDAHRLSEICPALRLTVAECTLAELTLAFSQQGERSFSIMP